MSSCVFCAIVANPESATVLCESEHFICFLPLAQETPGHTIIASKAHYQSMLDAPLDLGRSLFSISRELLAYHNQSTGAEGFNLLNANEAVAQQSIMHLHFHFLPRHGNDAIDAWPVLPGAKS